MNSGDMHIGEARGSISLSDNFYTPLKSGWMMKKGRVSHAFTADWKKRYFELFANTKELMYFSSKPPTLEEIMSETNNSAGDAEKKSQRRGDLCKGIVDLTTVSALQPSEVR